jgi:hypothetical protein
MPSLATNHHRNRPAIGPCISSPAEISCLRLRPREASPKHLTSRIATTLRQSHTRDVLARPEPHNASVSNLSSLLFVASRSVCLLTFCFLYSLLCPLTCSFRQERVCSFHSTSLLKVRGSANGGLCKVRLDAGRHCWRKASTSSLRNDNEPPI